MKQGFLRAAIALACVIASASWLVSPVTAADPTSAPTTVLQSFGNFGRSKCRSDYGLLDRSCCASDGKATCSQGWVVKEGDHSKADNICYATKTTKRYKFACAEPDYTPLCGDGGRWNIRGVSEGFNSAKMYKNATIWPSKSASGKPAGWHWHCGSPAVTSPYSGLWEEAANYDNATIKDRVAQACCGKFMRPSTHLPCSILPAQIPVKLDFGANSSCTHVPGSAEMHLMVVYLLPLPCHRPSHTTDATVDLDAIEKLCGSDSSSQDQWSIRGVGPGEFPDNLAFESGGVRTTCSDLFVSGDLFSGDWDAQTIKDKCCVDYTRLGRLCEAKPRDRFALRGISDLEYPDADVPDTDGTCASLGNQYLHDLEDSFLTDSSWPQFRRTCCGRFKAACCVCFGGAMRC